MVHTLIKKYQAHFLQCSTALTDFSLRFASAFQGLAKQVGSQRQGSGLAPLRWRHRSAETFMENNFETEARSGGRREARKHSRAQQKVQYAL